jgi:hypothetical protein
MMDTTLPLYSLISDDHDHYKGNLNSLGKYVSLKGKSEVNIYARRGLGYNTCLARGNLKRML